jgi:hypothetical protein
MLIAEGMWQQMAMDSGATMQPGSYPERPGEPDCTYYLRTGLCRFGMSCRFNHPPDRNLVNIPAFPNCDYLSYCFESPDVFLLSNVIVVMYISSIVMDHMRLEEYLFLNQRHFPFWCVSVASRNKMQEAMFEKKICDDVSIWSLLVFNPFPTGKHTKILVPQ